MAEWVTLTGHSLSTYEAPGKKREPSEICAALWADSGVWQETLIVWDGVLIVWGEGIVSFCAYWWSSPSQEQWPKVS